MGGRVLNITTFMVVQNIMPLELLPRKYLVINRYSLPYTGPSFPQNVQAILSVSLSYR